MAATDVILSIHRESNFGYTDTQITVQTFADASSSSAHLNHNAMQQPPLRPLLPKSASQTRLEPFLLEATPELIFERPQRKREPKGKNSARIRVRLSLSEHHPGPNPVDPCRSAAQRARRQRELAATIEGLLPAGTHQECTDKNFPASSRAQKLRRRVEEGEKRLEADPDCDITQALDRVLDKEYSINNPGQRRQAGELTITGTDAGI
ncbi:hypothetical protein B0H12DRAFT_1148055 [Mycena haematopus]|nr:hypothetical protein B0H12DRAFT_1148055 [Mycena haematopus]